MKTILMGWLMVSSLCFGNDTIPLKNKTLPAPGDRTESDLLTAPKSITTKKAGDPLQSEINAKAPPPQTPYIASLETFGSKKINERTLRDFLGKDLNTWFEKGLQSDKNAMSMENTLKNRVKDKFDFAMVEWSIIQYFEPGDMAIHVTLDVVEKKDVATRMPFITIADKQLPDPDGLLASWLEYETKALDLVEKGQLEPQTERCVALHCPFGHKHEALKKYEKIFLEGVKKNEAALAEIIRSDSRADNRASAVYLLAYLKDGKKVIQYMVDRIKDPDDLVRNNSLRVLGDIAEAHPEFVIPVKPVLEALKYPRVSDRSKAVYVAFNLSSNSREARDAIMKGAIPDLIAIMESKQPDHRELAHGILRKVSGKDFAPGDLRAWNQWWQKVQSSDKAIVKKP